MTINNDAPYGSKSPWGSEVNKLAPYLYDTNFGRTIPDDYRSQTPAPIIPPGRINPAPVTPPPTLTIAQILGASASQITAWRGNSNYLPVLHRVLNTFSAANGAAISATQVTSLGAALAYLSPAGLRSLTYLAMQAVTSQVLMQPSANGAGDYVVDSLTQYQIQNLPNSTIASFTSSALSSTIAATGRSLLASLYYSQLGVISTGALGGLTLADLTQTSVLTPNGRSITVLQAMPWANIAQLSPAVVGALTASHLALTNLQAQATRAGTPVQTVLQGLTGSQVQKINTTTVQMLSNAQLTQTDAGGRLVWQDIIMNPAQASYLPSAFQWGNLTSTQVTSLFANLVKTVTVPNLGLGSFAAIPVASLVNGIIGLGANAGAFITALSNAQLAALTPNQVNGLITSSSGMAAILLNAGSPNSLSVSQFQALVTGNTTIAQINSTVLGKTLSVPALLSLTTPEITQFTGTQWQAILSNPALSRVIYNAGSGNGYWTAAQLQAVSATAIAQTTQNQYLQFTRGLSMFSQAQQNAMSTNVALLEIMITGQTGVWTQSQIAWIVENIPGVMSLSGLPGGGAGCFKGGNNENAGLRYQIQGGAYATMTSGVQIGAAISAAGWNSLSATNRAELLANPALQGVLRDLNRTQFIDVLSNANLMPQLNGNNLAALVPSIRRHILSMNNAERATLVQLNQNQISTLIGVRDGAYTLGHIAQSAPNALPGGRFSPENITALIAASRGVDALEHIARFAPNTLPVGGLSSENITALIGVNGGAYALAHIAQYAPNTLPGGRLSSENITALIAANRDVDALAQIAQYAPNTLTDIRFSPENITALIAANGGAYALAHIARYAPNTLTDIRFSPENITALIRANGGVDALVSTLQDAPILSGGRFSPENITALIAANGGVDALAQIARLTPAMLADTALSQAQVNDLLSIAANITLTPRQRDRAIFALGSIAQYVRAMLADTVLSQAQVNNLLSIAVNTGFTASQRANAVAALNLIAQHVPAMLAGRVLSQAQVNNLLSIVANITLTPDQREGAVFALGSIAQYMPAMLAGRALSQAQVNDLLSIAVNTDFTAGQRANAIETLDLIAQNMPAMLAGTALSQAQVDDLLSIAVNTDFTARQRRRAVFALGLIAQYVPAMLADTVLSQTQVNDLLSIVVNTDFTAGQRDYAVFALGVIAQYVPAMLAGTALSQAQVNNLLSIAVNTDFTSRQRVNAVAALNLIAQHVPAMLAGRVLSQAQVNNLLSIAANTDFTAGQRGLAVLALGSIAQYVPAMLAGTALSQAQVNDFLSIAANITLTPDQRVNAALALGSIAQHVPAMLAGTALSQAQVNNLLSIAANITLTADQRGLAVFALGSIAQYVPAMLAGTALSQAQVNNLLSIAVNTDFTAGQREGAVLALGSIAQHVPGMLADIQITAGFFSGLNSSPELGVGFSNLVQMNLISGFDAGVLTSATLSNLSTVSALEGTVASLIANGRQDWINQALSTVTDLNLRANYQPDALLPSQLVGAAQTNTFDALYDAIRVAQGGNYTLSAAAFEAYAVTLQGGQYLNWLIVHHPDVVRATLTAAQNAQHAFVGGLSGPGLSATFLTQAGNNFWNEVATNHPDIVRFMGNNWANVFSNWSASAVRALGVHAVNQGGTGFIGLVSNNTNARALLGGAISRGVVINPEIFDAFATTAANFLGALTEMYIDVTSGSSLPFRALSLDGLVNLLRNGGVVLRDAEATQFSAISSNVLAALTSTQASLLPANFWQSITTTQLTAMFNSASLGVAFFGNANTPNHISQASLDAINPDVLAQSVAAVSTIREAIGGNWTLLTNAQQNSLVGANIPNFIPLQGHGGFAGNPLMINQQVVSGISLLAEQVTGVNSALMGSAQAALTEVQEVIKTGYQGEVATGATWAKGSTVTVSAAGFTDDQKAQLNSVLAQYANITGLTFQAVDSGGQINLGFANLGTATTGSVGLATITESNGQMQSAQILLENPAEDPIDVNGNYAGTQASFTQVLLHEIGHALGLADNNMAGSVENFYLGENNRTLSANDIAALQGLYDMPSGTSANANPVSLITVKALHQLVQAMAIANTPVGAITTSTGVFANNPVAGSSLTLAASTIH